MVSQASFYNFYTSCCNQQVLLVAKSCEERVTHCYGVGRDIRYHFGWAMERVGTKQPTAPGVFNIQMVPSLARPQALFQALRRNYGSTKPRNADLSMWALSAESIA